jgi:arginyl-tRNA--protein-N-Asp/Glu arginylyltransferase
MSTMKRSIRSIDDQRLILSSTEIDHYRQLLSLMEYQTTLINDLSRKANQTLQRIFVLELHDLLIRSLSRTIYFYQPFIDFVW